MVPGPARLAVERRRSAGGTVWSARQSICLSVISSIRPSIRHILLSVRVSVISVYPSVSPSVSLSVGPSVRSSVRLSACTPIRLSVCPSACPSVRRRSRPSVRSSVRLSFCLSVRSSVRLSVCPFLRPSVRLSICPSVRPSVFSLSFCLSVCLSVRQSVRLSVCRSAVTELHRYLPADPLSRDHLPADPLSRDHHRRPDGLRSESLLKKLARHGRAAYNAPALLSQLSATSSGHAVLNSSNSRVFISEPTARKDIIQSGVHKQLPSESASQTAVRDWAIARDLQTLRWSV